MRIPWWSGVALSTFVWVVSFVVLGAPESSTAFDAVAGPVVWATLAAWLAMPVCIYLDQRSAGDDLAWDPATALWVLASLVWFLNVVVGAAYCARRYAAARRTPPSRQWSSVVLGSLLALLVAYGLDYGLPDGTLPSPVVDAMVAVVAVAYVTLPAAILVDAVRVRGYSEWDPNSRGYLVGVVIPLVQLLVGGVYLYKRREALADVDPDDEFSLPEAATADDGDGVPGSPWFRRAGYLFGAYFVLLVLAGAALPSLSELAFEVLAIAAWVPFGPFFGACVYKDAAWRRERDRRVGDNWWLYLAAVLVQAAAFWYLVRRAGKATEYRQRAQSIEN